MQKLKEKLVVSPQQAELVIPVRKAKKISKTTGNWKAPYRDRVQGYRIKRYGECHAIIAALLESLLNIDQVTTELLTMGRTVLRLTHIKKQYKGQLPTDYGIYEPV